MAAPTVSYAALIYTVTFSLPSNTGGTGVTIDGYEILFKQSNGDWSVATGCDGTDLTVISTRTCDVALTTLTAAPFSLVQGN